MGKMIMIKKTGLVPVRDNVTGEIFGVSPETARTEIARGRYTAITENIPKDYETEELDAPDGPSAGTNSANSTSQSVEEKGPTEIPEDWKTMQHLQRIKLAKELYPDFKPEDKWSADLADQKIQEEVDRRTAEQSQV